MNFRVDMSDLPASSPSAATASISPHRSNAGRPEPLYVVPLSDCVVLASSEEALAVLGRGEMH
jgi:hypothetical protein